MATNPRKPERKADDERPDRLALREMSLRSDFYSGFDLWRWGGLTILFLSAGAALFIVAPAMGERTLTPSQGGRALAPIPLRTILRIAGGICAAIGLIQASEAGRLIRLLLRGVRLRARLGSLPWTRDYPWDPTGHSDGSLDPTLRYAIAGLLWFSVFNLFPTLLVAGYVDLSWKTALIAIVSALASLPFLYFLTIRKVWHYLAFGSSRLVFERVPYAPGELFEAGFIPGRSLGHYEQIEFTLRCIQPVKELEHRLVKGRLQDVYVSSHRQLHVDQFTTDSPGDWLPGSPPLPITFALPDNPELSTLLSGPVAVIEAEEGPEDEDNIPILYPPSKGMKYWELHVRAIRPGIDYKASFLVPVYVKP